MLYLYVGSGFWKWNGYCCYYYYDYYYVIVVFFHRHLCFFFWLVLSFFLGVLRPNLITGLNGWRTRLATEDPRTLSKTGGLELVFCFFWEFDRVDYYS